LAVISGFTVVGPSPAIVATEAPAEVKVNVEAQKPLTVKEEVTKYFSDIPIMIDIARCESRFRQTDKNGNTLRGEVNNLDVGVMQINEKYHLETSKKLGYNIHTIEGNMEYARYLYKKEGARPWLSSSPCWANTETIAMR
jgi:hypothetical protein